MNDYKIRMAVPEDAESILNIYGPYIENTVITFEYERPVPEAFADRIREIVGFYPYLVYEEDGKIRGYAYAHRQMERAAYQWNAELSVYVDEEARGKGIGKALYGVILELLKRQNICNVYAGVTCPNERSESLHRHFGFELLGIYHNTGYKFGKWHDVMWFEKFLNKGEEKPRQVKSVHDLDKEEMAEILQSRNF